jgi:predicted Zn-dependent protease
VRFLRPALLLAAVLACVWFVIGVRQAHEVDAASNVITAGQQSPSQLRGAASQLHAAAFLNPDRAVDILRGRVAIEQRRLAQARRILGAVVRAEPQNLEGWIWFTGANLGLPAAERGSRRIAALDPLDARVVGR